MARKPKKGVVQTQLGPLPQDFFEFQGLPDDATPQAKLRAQLAHAYNIWRGAKDDHEGQNRRRYAYQVALGAVLEYVKNDTPSEHLYLLVRLAEHLDDLNLGRHPKELKPALRLRPGNRGLETHRATTLAEACAMVDVLSKDPRPSSKEKIEEEVAEAIGERPRAFRSWRKALNARR